MTPFRVHPEARDEARAATNWYRARSQDAALDFARTVRAGVQSIREQPAACACWQDSDARRKVLSRFPYSIFYVVENDTVIVVAIAHHTRRPGYWRPRLRTGG